MTSCDEPEHDNVWSVRFLLKLHRDTFLHVQIPMKGYHPIRCNDPEYHRIKLHSLLCTGRRRKGFVSTVQVNAVLIIVILTRRILQRSFNRETLFCCDIQDSSCWAKRLRQEGGGGERTFFSKEIRLMDMIILIKSLGFKYTVE